MLRAAAEREKTPRINGLKGIDDPEFATFEMSPQFFLSVCYVSIIARETIV
jgi:hypothetical protein